MGLGRPGRIPRGHDGLGRVARSGADRWDRLLSGKPGAPLGGGHALRGGHGDQHSHFPEPAWCRLSRHAGLSAADLRLSRRADRCLRHPSAGLLSGKHHYGLCLVPDPLWDARTAVYLRNFYGDAAARGLGASVRDGHPPSPHHGLALRRVHRGHRPPHGGVYVFRRHQSGRLGGCIADVPLPRGRRRGRGSSLGPRGGRVGRDPLRARPPRASCKFWISISSCRVLILSGPDSSGALS